MEVVRPGIEVGGRGVSDAWVVGFTQRRQECLRYWETGAAALGKRRSPRFGQEIRGGGRGVSDAWVVGFTQRRQECLRYSGFFFLGRVTSGSASTLTSTSAPGVRATSSPAESLSVFSTRISL